MNKKNWFYFLKIITQVMNVHNVLAYFYLAYYIHFEFRKFLKLSIAAAITLDATHYTH